MSIINQILHFTFLSASFLSFIAGRRYLQYRTAVGRWGGAFNIVLGVELLSYTMQWTAEGTGSFLIWRFFQIISFNLLGILWLFYLLELTKGAGKQNLFVLFLLFCLPVVGLGALLLQRLPLQYSPQPGMMAAGSVLELEPILGDAGLFYTAFFFTVAVLSLLAGLRFLLFKNKNRAMLFLAIVALFGTAFLGIMGALEHAGIHPFQPVHTFQVGLALVGFLFFYVVVVRRFWGILPVGRSSVFEDVFDGILLLDAGNTILDLNPAAQRIFKTSSKEAINQRLPVFWPPGARLLAEHPFEKFFRAELPLTVEGVEYQYDVAFTRFIGVNNTTTGRMIVLRNVTGHEKMAEIIDDRNKALAHTNMLLQGLAEVNLNIQHNTDISSIYKTLGQKLKDLNLNCYVFELDAETNHLTPSYLSNPPRVVTLFEKTLGFKTIGHPLDRKIFTDLYTYVDSDKTDYFDLGFRNAHSAGGGGLAKQIEKALQVLGVNTNTPLMVLQLWAGEKKLGLMGVWGENLKEEDLSTFRIFANQLAWSIERLHLYNNEVKRSAELAHSNRLISALANVSAQMGTSSDSRSAFDILGEELEKLELHCALASLTPSGDAIKIEYSSFTSHLGNLARKIPNFHLEGYEIPGKFFKSGKVLTEGIVTWYQNPGSFFAQMFPMVPKQLFNQAVKQLELTAQDNLCFLPLIINGGVSGVLTIWGKSIQQSDTPTLLVFAQQVAEMLRKTKNYEEELSRANNLARSNAMVLALSNVAARLETTLNLGEVFETLGRELRKIDINCMVGTLDEAKQELKIEYLSIIPEIMTWAARLDILWPEDVRVPRNLWPTDKAVTGKTPYWDPDPIGNTSKMFPLIPKGIFIKTFEMAGMDPTDPVCYLPMISDEDVIGIMAVWGPNLKKDDVSGLSVFANQVATAIKSTKLFYQAQEEILSRTQAETRLQEALDEKEILLKEIHHRVKNNLQVISSLLNLQMNQYSDTESVESLRESQSRVRAMALIHEKLYQSNNLAQVDFSAYLTSLTYSLTQTYPVNPQKIVVQVKAENIMLDLDTATPCGLIVNELVSNALKYAFPDDKKGCIQISCHQNSQKCTLLVEDDGVGLPAGFDPAQSATLGLKLVSSLVRQIDGEMRVNGKPGARFEIVFPRLRN